MIFQVNVMATHMERLLIEGNKDGSMNVAFPKQVSQFFSLLIASWISPSAFEVPYKEYVDNVLFFEQLGVLLGVPFKDEETKELYLALVSRELEQ